MAMHIHHDMIVEWAKDTSRVVQCLDVDGSWIDMITPIWHPECVYRFKPNPVKAWQVLYRRRDSQNVGLTNAKYTSKEAFDRDYSGAFVDFIRFVEESEVVIEQ